MDLHAEKVDGWFTSSACGSQGGGCVEVARSGEGMAVRDGKDPGRPALEFTAEQWRAFLAGVQAGEFDLV